MHHMKKVLVLYYSQTGQLHDIIASILAPIENNPYVSVSYEALQPEKPYPFPWTAYQFADVFPEAFAGVACEMKPLACNSDEDYDLIVLAYTVWYLAPSIPVTSFMLSPEAKRILKNRPVLTIIGCRNMWLLAQEKIKQKIKDAGGRLTGNIVLTDKASNLVGVLTIAVWMLTGKKERFLRIFPRPGISDRDIREAGRFGSVILSAVTGEKIALDQDELNARGAVAVDPSLLLMEKRVSKVFNLWSAFIRSKGGPGDLKRSRRVRAFIGYLIAAVIVLAPLASIAGRILKVCLKDKIAVETDYFSHNELRTEVKN